MSLELTEPTIAAIATPPGLGGIGIVRISGTKALEILTKLFTPRHPVQTYVSHRMYYGWILDPGNGRPLDEVLAVYMQSPNTYTREDVVEIHCHGSYLVLQDILQQIVSLGARLAEPGEFTKRAFLNGRIDLTQAEAVLELLEAKTKKSLDMALDQLQGGLQQQVLGIRNSLIAVKGIIEVAIDFPDEEVEIIQPAALAAQLRTEVLLPLQELLQSSEHGRIFREGVSIVILGRPNVGKSSLLNALLKEDRAIVTEIPGTTRDTIEEYLDINGLPVRIIDTAGIRTCGEAVEEIGIRRAREKVAAADIVVLMLDASMKLRQDDLELLNSIAGKTVIIAVNKKDLAPRLQLDDFLADFPALPATLLSAKSGEGLKELEELLFATATRGNDKPTETDHRCVPNVRHRAALQKTKTAVDNILSGIAADVPADLLAVDIQAALDSLGDIVGQTTTDDVLDWIFHQFCLGK